LWKAGNQEIYTEAYPSFYYPVLAFSAHVFFQMLEENRLFEDKELLQVTPDFQSDDIIGFHQINLACCAMLIETLRDQAIHKTLEHFLDDYVMHVNLVHSQWNRDSGLIFGRKLKQFDSLTPFLAWAECFETAICL
jgi:hypothetical protein